MSEQAKRTAHAGAHPRTLRPAQPLGGTPPHRWHNPIGLVGAPLSSSPIAALAAPLIAPYDPDAQDSERLLPPR